MQQKNMLWILVIFLLLLNTGTLLFLFWDRRPVMEHSNSGFDAKVIRALRLDEDQQIQFEHLKREHHEQVLAIDHSMHELFIAYFSLLDNPGPANQQRDSLEQLLAAAYDHKVKITYAHFRDLKAICRPEQQAHFNELLPDLMQVISQPGKKRGLLPEGN
jgi:hypothetical protein